MTVQDQYFYDLFQHLLEDPDSEMPNLDSSARTAKEAEELTALVDFTDRLRYRSAPVINSEVALSRARARVLASVATATATAESPLPAAMSKPVAKPATQASPGPWQGFLDIFRAPAVPAWATASIAILLVLFVSVYMSVVFSANAMPGDVLYPVKLAVEEAIIILTPNWERKGALIEEQNQERLREVGEIIKQGGTARVTFSGQIKGRDGDYWLIGDYPVLVDDGSDFLENLEVGSSVSVVGVVSADGVILHSVISAPVSKIPTIASTPPPPTSVPGSNLMSEPTDTPAPLPTRKPTQKPAVQVPVKPGPTQKPKPTRVVVATPSPTPFPDGEITPTGEVPVVTLTTTPVITITPVETTVGTGTPTTAPALPTNTPVVGTPTPRETVTPSETALPTPTTVATTMPVASPSPQVTDTIVAPTQTSLPAATATPSAPVTPTPQPTDTSAPPANTPAPPTNTPLPPAPTSTPIPAPPTNTPAPPAPTNTPVPPPPTNTSVPPAPTNTPVARQPTPTP